MSKELKEYMAKNCSSGFTYEKFDFGELGELLQENAAYCAFKFKDGKRSKANIEGGCSWLVLDVDKSKLTDQETHLLLDEYNHFIARTSDPDNEFKFRVLIELDSVVDIDDRLWTAFITEVGEQLGLVIDNLPKSQIYFSFEDREILEQLEGSPLVVKPLLDKATIRVRDNPKPPRELPAKDKQQKLNDPRTTFFIGFEAEKGSRSRKMYRCLAYAIDLGADAQYIESLANEINQYWVEPLQQERLENTLIQPALRRL